MDDIWEEIQIIVKNVLNTQELQLTQEMSSENIPEWDSLNHVLIINEIEKKFQIKFSLDDMLSLNTLGELTDMVRNKT